MTAPFKEPIVVALESQEYEMAKKMLGSKTTTDGRTLLIEQVDQTLKVLNHLSSWPAVMRAACLRPLLQDDHTFEYGWKTACKNGVQPRALVLAMEFRRVANSYLCNTLTDYWDDEEVRIRLGLVIPPVRAMLIAHKTVGYYQFLMQQAQTHFRRKELRAYFERWFRILEADPKECLKLLTEAE